jgi:CheY-like chemotaxis protein
MIAARILVVEDTPLNMELATDLLEAAGHQVLQARSGADGVQLARTELPDLILSDIHLPDISGREVVRILKQDPRTRDIPAVALTAQAMRGDEILAREAGFDGYITKPIDTRSFASTATAFLRNGA